MIGPHDDSCVPSDGVDLAADSDSTEFDEWLETAAWADDVPLMCGVENPDVCESCQ